MLHEIDNALRALVERDAVTNGDVDIEFDAPTKDWATARNRPTIDIYLYDIRQDVNRNHHGEVRVNNDDGTVREMRPQPKWFRLSYLVTAWTQRPEDEHRLLSALMVTFLRNESLPRDLLEGTSLEDGPAVSIAVALPPPQDRSLSDVWSALGGELKPSLDVQLTAPLQPARADEAAPPVTVEPQLRIVDRHGGAQEELGLRPVPDDHRPGDDPGRRPPPRRTRTPEPSRASSSPGRSRGGKRS